MKLKWQGGKPAAGSDIKNVRFAKTPRPPNRIMATRARRAIREQTDNLSVALIRPVACFYDSIWGARGSHKTDNLYVGPWLKGVGNLPHKTNLKLYFELGLKG